MRTATAYAANGVPVLIAGVRADCRACRADMSASTQSNVPHAGIGTPAVLWGQGLPVEEVAAASGTVSYELLCAVARRVAVSESG
jgi:alanine racemase